MIFFCLCTLSPGGKTTHIKEFVELLVQSLLLKLRRPCVVIFLPVVFAAMLEPSDAM